MQTTKFTRTMIGAVLAALFLNGCDSNTNEPQVSAQQVSEQRQLAAPRLAKLLQIGAEQGADMLSYPAVIQSSQLTLLSFEVAGIVNDVKVVESQRVQQGDVLATLDKRVLTAALAAARAQFHNAQQEYDRAAKLIQHKAISASALEERKLALEVSEANFATADKSLQDAVLVAPFDAAVAKVAIKDRQVVQAGSAAITLLGAAGLEVKINLPADIIARARLQGAAPEDVYLALDAAPQRTIAASFKEASLQADSASQTYAASRP